MDFNRTVTASLLALALVTPGVAETTASFYSSHSPTAAQRGAHLSPDDVRIFTRFPATDTIVLGEMTVDGGSAVSLSRVMESAVREAASRGADFVALAEPDQPAPFAIGKMVAYGHGRSVFVAGSVTGSDLNWVSSSPRAESQPMRLVFGAYRNEPASAVSTGR